MNDPQALEQSLLFTGKLGTLTPKDSTKNHLISNLEFPIERNL